MDQDSVTSLVRFDIKFTYKIIADFCGMLKSQPSAVTSAVLHYKRKRGRHGSTGTSQQGAEIEEEDTE